MRKYLLYKTTNKNDGKYYIGAHETTKEKDSYLGSGIHLKKAIKKYGRGCFIRETLIECKSKEEMFLEEQKLISLHLGDPKCYNLKSGGVGGWNYVNKSGMMLGANNPMKNSESLKKCTENAQRTRALDPEKYKLISIANCKKATEKNIGTKRPKEFCELIRNQSKLRWETNKEAMRDALSSWYIVIDPMGNEEKTNRLEDYCLQRYLSYATMLKTINTEKTPNRGKAKGWLCRKITQN